LANLTTTHAINTIYELGKTLARRNMDYAADFCFLSVHILAGYDVFSPLPVDDSFRQHIALIHATLPDEDDQWTMHLGFEFVLKLLSTIWFTLTVVSAGH
jgi:hypothetical protein